MTGLGVRPESPPSGAAAPPAAAPKRQFHRLRVGALHPLTADSVAITFEVPDHLRETFRFTQGQHVALRCTVAGDDVRRNYSLCSSATSQLLRVAVKRLPGGVFSSYAMQSLRPGDMVEVMPPAGRFFVPLDPTQARNYAAIAAGSGIAPIISILATTLEVEPASRFTLLYGNRGIRSIMFLEELEDLKNRFPDRLSLVNVLSRETPPVELFHGRIDGSRLDRLCAVLVPPETIDHWFLCGPFRMVDELRSTLAERGVDRRRVHIELFHSDATLPRDPRADPMSAGVGGASADRGPAAAAASTVTIVLDGRQTSFALARTGSTILDAALRERDDAPYACKGGVCGTCRARLRAGTVEMERSFALEDGEREAGFVLACQSHPTSPQVVLDFDQ